MIAPADKDSLISNPNVGKEVSFAPAIKNEGLLLKRAARQGFYYPMLAIKHLNALSTGLSGKRNVFIPNYKDFKANSFQKVVVFVPGIEATVERRANDSLVVTKLVLSEEYKSIERRSGVKPGVYRVTKVDGKIKLDYKRNGRITPNDDRYVVVADTKYNTPTKAATSTASKLEAIFSSVVARRCDFDLFYSPIGGDLKGMKNYNPDIHIQSYAFSGLLADTLEKSKDQTGIAWASELGGSVVLTQGLQTLARKRVASKEPPFKNKNHVVKMYMPTTNPNPTFYASQQLGMHADKDLAKGNGNIRASISSMMFNAKRASNKDDDYNWNDYAKDMSDGTMVAATATGVLALGASTVIGAPILVTIGSAATIIGGIPLACSIVKKRLG